MQIRFALSLVHAALVSACASSSSYQNVPFPSQEVELSSPGLARIYMARESQVAGSIRGIRVYESDQEIGSIGEGSYLCWERLAGRSLVELEYEGPQLDEQGLRGLLELDCEAGEVYYYAVHLEPAGKKPIAQLQSSEDGKALIARRSPATKN